MGVDSYRRGKKMRKQKGCCLFVAIVGTGPVLLKEKTPSLSLSLSL